MKKRICAVFLTVLAACRLLGGCTAADGRPALRQGTAPNEVLTLTEVPEDKMILIMHGEDGIDYARIERAIETKFPAVDIVPVNNTSVGLDYLHGGLQDIFLSSLSKNESVDYLDALIDLSGESFTQNYYLNALQDCSIGGRLPYLPGPSNVYGIVYNRTLFDKHGWTVPGSLDEFIALCRTIDAAGIRAVQPSLYYADAARQFFCGFTYEKLFAGVDNYSWLKSYRSGKATMTGHIEPGFDAMQRLMDAGVLRPEDFNILPGVRSEMMYCDQTCAMIMETQMAPVYAASRFEQGREVELGMMPFYSGGPESDYLFSVPNFYIGVSARLNQPGNEEKRRQALEIVGWISSVEGQLAIIDPATPMMSNVKGVPFQNNEFLADVRRTIEKGRVAPQPFWVGNVGTAVDQKFQQSFEAWVNGRITLGTLIVECDAARDNVLAGRQLKPTETMGRASADFTVLETSLYIAELFQREMDADIGLCLSNSRQCGNNLRLYAGDIDLGGNDLTAAQLERCFTSDTRENLTRQLWRVQLTGRQILEILERPPEQNMYPDAYYVAAGLKIEFAPWAAAGERYRRVTLASGAPLDPDASYTVALWRGSVREEYISAPEAVSNHTVVELLAADLHEKGEISPSHEGFTLCWDN